MSLNLNLEILDSNFAISDLTLELSYFNNISCFNNLSFLFQKKNKKRLRMNKTKISSTNQKE